MLNRREALAGAVVGGLALTPDMNLSLLNSSKSMPGLELIDARLDSKITIVDLKENERGYVDKCLVWQSKCETPFINTLGLVYTSDKTYTSEVANRLEVARTDTHYLINYDDVQKIISSRKEHCQKFNNTFSGVLPLVQIVYNKMWPLSVITRHANKSWYAVPIAWQKWAEVAKHPLVKIGIEDLREVERLRNEIVKLEVHVEVFGMNGAATIKEIINV